MMNEAKWVRHISGMGEKWQVMDGLYNCREENADWCVHSKNTNSAKPDYHYLPKSEYTLCDPPHRWVDITADCDVDADGYITHNGKRIEHFVGYRARKKRPAQGPYFSAFIIEQRVPV